MVFRTGQLLMCSACFAALLSHPQLTAGDIFQLKSGGQVVGVIVDRGKQGEYVVQSDEGAVVTLSRRQVKRVVPQDKIDLQYATRSRTLPDTVEAHRELAAWCKENRLSTKLVHHHLRRILELNPTDEAARLSLGYQKHRGRWMMRGEIMNARGLQKFDGDFRTAQDIALRKRTDQRKRAEADWFRKIRTWVRWLDDRRAEEAAELIAEVKDPLAAVAIVKLLDNEKNQNVRELLTATLAEIRHPLSAKTLVTFSLLDPDQEVRLQCIEYLNQFHRPISLSPYIKTLKDRDNEVVNRAAEALRRFENPRAVSPLIDALVTTHKFKNLNAPTGNMNADFSPNGGGPGGGGGSGGGGGLNMGGNKSKVILRDLQNLKVRQALVELSGGQDYEFDERLRRMWYVNEQIHDYVDTRRDR